MRFVKILKRVIFNDTSHRTIFGADTPLNIMGELNGHDFRKVFACMKKALAEVRK